MNTFEMAVAAELQNEHGVSEFAYMDRLRYFEAMIRADEREAIMDEWWMCVQSDLENGVKSLNERAAEKWKKEYPEIAGFAATIEARNKK
jgi:hypothetical protein